MREPRAPIYSMGARLGFALKRPGPAANAYAIRESRTYLRLQPDRATWSFATLTGLTGISPLVVLKLVENSLRSPGTMIQRPVQKN